MKTATSALVVGLLVAALLVQLSVETPMGRTPFRQSSGLVGADPNNILTFGSGISQGVIRVEESNVFSYNIQGTGIGAMTHFWITGSCPYPNTGKGNMIDDSVIRYYVDGEAVPSVDMVVSLGCGVGFDDQQAPWGTSLIGKGAATGGWFHNIRIPFGKSIRVTARLPMNVTGSTACGYYIIVRGAEGIPVSIGDIQLPAEARMRLYKVDNHLAAPIEYVTMANVPKGLHGAVLLMSMQVQSGNLNFLEGCFRAYGVGMGDSYPGLQLSTGTEDYFDSAYYFNAGEFHLPVSGFTHIDTSGNTTTWSAYRTHITDPLFFKDGMQFIWRNGDTSDTRTGLKCTLETGGVIAGSPTASLITSYVWVYQW